MTRLFVRLGAASLAFTTLALAGGCAGTRGDAQPEARADAWSRFRGPNGSGVAEAAGLPGALDPATQLRWRTELPPGHSSPVLTSDAVYLTAFEGDELQVYRLARDTGAIDWVRVAPRTRITTVDQRNNAASPSPAVDAEVVVVFFPDFGLLAYDHAGKQLWRVPLGPFENVYGMGASPVLVGDRVILPCDQNLDSYVLALDKHSGKQLWCTARPAATSGHCTPIVWEAADASTQILLPGSFFLDAYDVLSGERVWWVGGLCFEMKSVPVLHDGLVYINGYGSPLNDPGNQVEVDDFDVVLAERDQDGDGLVAELEMPPGPAVPWFGFVDLNADARLDAGEWNYLRAALRSRNGVLAIRPGGQGDRTAEAVAWSYHRSVPQLPSPLIYHDVLYLVADSGGRITTLDPETGALLERGRVEDAIDNYYASPVAGDDKVYLVSESGLLVVLSAGGSLEAQSVVDLEERCHATPAIDGDQIFVRSEAALYCFGLAAR